MDPAQYPDILAYLQVTAPFSELPKAVQLSLCPHIKIRYVGQSQPTDLLEQPEIHWLRSGFVELYNVQNERQETVDTGGSFGQVFNGEQTLHIRVLQDALVYSLAEDLLHQLANEHPPLHHFISNAHNRYLSLPPQQSNLPTLQSNIDQLIQRDLIAIKPEASIQLAAKRMTLERVSALAIVKDGRLFGVLTDRDLRSRVLAEGIDPEQPVSQVMTTPVHTIDKHALALDALMEMSERQIHHLPVTQDEVVIGMITSTDLLALVHSNPIHLVSEISRQNSPKAVEQTCQKLASVVESMTQQGLRGDKVSQFISMVADAACRRLLTLAEAKLGAPPQSYAWLSFGSQARRDMSIASDQDNGLLLAEPITPEQRSYFTQLADGVCQSLHRCGFVQCPGQIMGNNPKYQLSRLQWLDQFERWQRNGDPEATLNASIFFDYRAVYDPYGLAQQLQQQLQVGCRNNQLFLSLLARNANHAATPFGTFGRFFAERIGSGSKGICLKQRAYAPLIDIMRVYGLASASAKADFRSRAEAAYQQQLLSKVDYKNLIECWQFLLSLKLELGATTTVKPSQLSELQRHQLKECFGMINQAQKALILKFAGGRP
ncbi:DUF294 nucleotidyltransferase-like domain-containing protein [Echinimonas agarilytica]|uniref:DUF294 nucleotidyltransferase-like domain-containing protein n=1 Tax=Echinimonas agarilytica TaxID=1215918 RepID=A0AA42B7R1_9GAMM|nr:DUF294 nucleotidyltransferase-like domain-containing protein [Echinimonas agarilytica]MCM2680062.1 DUF294 nucleotidyltransferase-like domain-containing protein [Echinimonas agarilytica]